MFKKTKIWIKEKWFFLKMNLTIRRLVEFIMAIFCINFTLSTGLFMFHILSKYDISNLLVWTTTITVSCVIAFLSIICSVVIGKRQ